MTAEIIKLPRERVGVLVGQNGAVKSEIEQRTGVKITVESEEGIVYFDDDKAFEPVLSLKARDVVKAIGRGFSPEKAFRLFQDETYLDIIDITDFIGKDGKDLERVRSRLIGTGGKTRASIEDASGAHVSIFGKTVGLLGEIEEVQIAHEAVEMILDGAPHTAVYKFLERRRKELRLHDLGF